MQSEFRFRSRATKRNRAKGSSKKYKATEWGLKKFDKWCEKRAIKVDLKTIDKKELNKILRKFYVEVKTEKGQALTPRALTGIRAAIHRHLTSAPLHRTAISCLPTKCLKPKPVVVYEGTKRKTQTQAVH